MEEYKEYSKDVWDYLIDMPYLPSRKDRDQFLEDNDARRVRIWDYFFRIRPDDLGKPQKSEIISIDQSLNEHKNQFLQAQDEINEAVRKYKKEIYLKWLRNFIYSLACFVFAGILYKIISNLDAEINSPVVCPSIFVVAGIIFLIGISFVGWDEKTEIRDLKKRLSSLREEYRTHLQKGADRKNFLRSEIRALKLQLPTPPSGMEVREWLREDFRKLWEKSKEDTALGNRLIDIASEEVDERGNKLKFPNPIPVFGPAELQQTGKIPPTFSNEVYPNLHKHLTARRSFQMTDSGWIEVLFGMYYLEHILIADDMLATCGFFYDFITGKIHAEQTTEQYYDDVVAIVVTNEFRKIQIKVSDLEKKYIQEAPTFTLSLASGEHRTVTFVSEKYFQEIKNEIQLAEDDIPRIYWIGRSRKDVDNAIKALRSQLRLHKGTEDI
jgi:hypothetical protein